MPTPLILDLANLFKKKSTAMASDRATLRPPSISDQYSEDGDDIMLPEGALIYAQLQYLDTYKGYADDEDSYDDMSDEEAALDLSAPPSESWYHGKISRQMSYERLQAVGVPGAYLVRDSTNIPGDYAISYLSKLGQIHHFKINSICGDYYIGGRQFSSLVDLIGYYTNCSYILENEGLEVPIMPPAPVKLHSLWRAVEPHRKAPGTDELNIAVGEVFVLLSDLNKEWGWGCSQKTGESGLIPLSVMEFVADADSNYGKPWYHGETGREEAIDLLMQKGGPGDFLVRPGQHEGMYSLSVRTFESVQRFLIQKDSTGYYVVGGRCFNSMDDIIDRYKKEVILDGLKLQLPLPPQTTYADSYQHKHRGRTHSYITRGDFPGDKTGVLQLRRGKKSPVYGKWKEFYFHLQYKDQKLLYYDNEKSHRPRGLLDLKECKIHPVHPSLYGRDDCFVIMLQYLNELFYHYICTGTAESAQDWLRLMRQCTNKKSTASRSEVQQIRSLALQIKECRLTKLAHTQIFCRIAVDSCFVARTRQISDEQPCIFEDSYRFEDLQASSSVVTVDVTCTRKGLLSYATKDASLGTVELVLEKLPNGQDDDQWHTLLIPNTRASKGSLRVIATFKHEVILPLEEYRGLTEIILSDDLVVIETLARVCSEHHSELAGTLIEIFCHHQKVLQILSKCTERAIAKEDEVATLFRASTIATMLMDQFMKTMAMDYLLSVIRQPVQTVINTVESCELNPGYLQRGTDTTKNQEVLESHISLVLNEIYMSVTNCPLPLRYLFHCLQEQVKRKWPSDNGVRTRAVSGFLFLRLICPALLKPHLFNIISEPPSNSSDRSLKLVTKAVQNVANLVEFKRKEPFMIVLNSFIHKHMEKMRQFIDEVSAVSEMPKVNHSSMDPARAWAALSRLCSTYEKKLKEEAQKERKIIELLSIMQILKATEERYLSSRGISFS